MGIAPIKVLHVVGGMNRGGIETWLMNVLRRIDRERFKLDFLVHTTEPCAYDDEIRALGSRIIPCLHPHRPWTYASNFKRVLREHGPYDIIHSHAHHYSGHVVRLAHRAGVPTRIAHSHNTSDGKGDSVYRRLYHAVTERWIQKHATRGLAASPAAAAALYGPDWETDARFRVLYCGIETERFRQPVDRKAVRLELGLPDDSLIVGHVGRSVTQKHQSFLVDVAAKVLRLRADVYFLLIGDGPLKPQIEAKAREKGIEEHLVLTGARADVPRLMLGAMDLFVFPSLWEGLGIAVVEAQAAGLPCVVSDRVPREADVVQGLVERLPLESGTEIWAERVIRRLEEGPVDRAAALEAVAQSPFNIENSVRSLEQVYEP